MPSKNKAAKAKKKLLAWLDSYEKVSAAVDGHGDLLKLLKAGGGMCKIENFLPQFAADAILEILEALDERSWNVTEASDDYAHNNISHDFLSTKSELLEAIFRVFTLLLPDSLFTFSAAKYCKQGHIKPHDDRAYTQVCMEDGSIQLCSRNIAVIYYLTKGWTAADGGALIDHEAPGGPQTHTPQFNSVIAFTIPRWHEVTPVLTEKPRYSIFGWFLEPGQLYDLQLDPHPPTQPQTHLQHQQQPKPKHKVKRQAQTAGSPAAHAEGAQPQSQPAGKKKHKHVAAEGHMVQAQPPQQQQEQQLSPQKQPQQEQQRKQHKATESSTQQQVVPAASAGKLQIKPLKLPGLKAHSKLKHSKKRKDGGKQ